MFMPDDPTEGPGEAIDRFQIDSMPVADTSRVPESEEWRRAENVVKQVLKVQYGDEEVRSSAPSECPSGFMSVAQTPSDSAMFRSALSDIEPPLTVEARLSDEAPTAASPAASATTSAPVPAPAATEGKEVEELKERLAQREKELGEARTERNKLQARVTLLQSQVAKLQASTSKHEEAAAESTSERGAWIMLAAAGLILLAVLARALVLVFSSPSCSAAIDVPAAAAAAAEATPDAAEAAPKPEL